MSADLAARLFPAGGFRSGSAALAHLEPLLRRVGVEFECGTPDAVSWLTRRGGEAVTHCLEHGRALIWFLHAAPSLSAVLEELAHVLQERAMSYRGEDIRLMNSLREIEAKECLVEHQEELCIPSAEHDVTLKQLEAERMRFKRLKEQLA